MRALALFALALGLVACENTPTEAASDPAPTATPAPAPPTAAEIEAGANVPTATVSDDDMEASAEVVARGSFAGASGHDVRGEAILYRLGDGSHLVRLEGFETDNGPDLKVWLVRSTAQDVGRDPATLGALKSTNGDQNYPVPAGVDVDAYAGVSIWCERFSVNFGTAALDA